jgi:hypothetical protein
LECALYHSWTITPWTYFYDLPKVLNGVVLVQDANQKDPIRVFDRPNLTIPWVLEQIGITNHDEVFWVNDTVRYGHRILDDSIPELLENQPDLLGRFVESIKLSELKARQETLIHFNSLFSIDRIYPVSKSQIALASYINTHLDVWNHEILNATRVAEKQIEQWSKITKRATSGFLGVHFRTADGGFAKHVEENLQRIVEWLREMIKMDKKEINSPLQERNGKRQADNHNDNDNNNNNKTLSFLDRCMGQPAESPLIFMATDVHHPRTSPILSDFFDEFPCTTVLSDFPESVGMIDSIYNTVDNVHMLPYMIALMDANLASRGREFQGTENSTFTGYIKLHLWPEYHPGRQPRIPFW